MASIIKNGMFATGPSNCFEAQPGIRAGYRRSLCRTDIIEYRGKSWKPWRSSFSRIRRAGF